MVDTSGVYGPAYDQYGNLVNASLLPSNAASLTGSQIAQASTALQSQNNPTSAISSDDISKIVKQLTDFAASQTKNVPTPVIPPLNYTPPTSADIDQRYKDFLNKAAADPDIVNYYQKLLNATNGNLNQSLQLLENDYQTGVRQTTDNLTASLKKLGLTFTQEQDALKNTLNKRGIALTQSDSGKIQYAGAGQAQYELSQVQQDQQLRQEAETRSSQQGIENLALTKTKGTTGLSQQYDITTNPIYGTQPRQKQQDIESRAQTYENIAQQQESSKLQQAQIDQQKKMAGG